MTDDYVPLTDEQVAAMEIRDEAAFLVHPAEIDRAALLADRDYWKRRAVAAERRKPEWERDWERYRGK